ncbi:MAG: hypothetical protein R3F61_08780 [Myxococcota bacterium]
MRSPLFALVLAACTPPSDTGIPVDETGYLDDTRITYTSDAPLDGARTVTVFGLSGALDPAGGSLVVTGPSGTAAVEGPDSTGAFRAELTASLGDELTFDYTPPTGEPGTDRFTLDDALSTLVAPSGGSSSLVSDNGDGTVTVDFAFVATGGTPPFVAFNLDGGLPVVSAAGEAVIVEAVSGDSVCAFDLDLDGRQSPYGCETVP